MVADLIRTSSTTGSGGATQAVRQSEKPVNAGAFAPKKIG
jgi:hypothetical protein